MYLDPSLPPNTTHILYFIFTQFRLSKITGLDYTVLSQKLRVYHHTITCDLFAGTAHEIRLMVFLVSYNKLGCETYT